FESANDSATLVNSSVTATPVAGQSNKKPQLNHSPSHGRFSFESSSPPRHYRMTRKETETGYGAEYTLSTTRTGSSFSFHEDTFLAKVQNGKIENENGRESRMTAFYSCNSANTGLQGDNNERKSVDGGSLFFKPLTEEECV